MGTKLKIRWDGSAPGLASHRLSLSAFQETLQLLLTAYQRIASAMLADALGDPDYGVRGGRLNEKAKNIDLELANVGEGSAELTFECVARTPLGATVDAFNDLPERAMVALLDGIEAEGNETPRNAMVRRFLKSLEGYVSAQDYRLVVGDREVKSVRLGIPRLVADEIAYDLPNLLPIRGCIVGVGFEPGATEVRIRAEGHTMTCVASPAQVEDALAVRGGDIVALVLTGKRPSLMWIRPADAVDRFADPTRRTQAIFSRWGGLLRRLSE